MSEISETPDSPKQAILQQLKISGPSSAQALAERAGVTPMAIRQHLYALEEEGLVAAKSIAKGRGRPMKSWDLTDAAQNRFPDAHQGLAVDLITSMRSVFGESGLNQLVDRHSQKQLENYQSQMAGLTTTEERLRRLTKIRTDEGYMARLEKQGDDWVFTENNCPICSAAKTCTRLCANEQNVFQTLLGDDVTITRDEHIVSGARRCLYRITGTKP